MSKRQILVGLMVTAMVIAPIFVSEPTSSAAAAEMSIVDPVDFVWTDAGDHFVGVMEYGEATFTIDGKTLTTRAYRQEFGTYSIPGPTLRMVPGNKYVLRFRNLLPYEAPSGVHNDFKDPNITNVHTHGLHISGEAPGDDVTRMFEGGFGGDYVYDIPANHMGGTFWYHAHHHGSTFLQVSTGGFGLIIIDDGNDGIPANVAAMAERQILIGYLDPGAAGTGGDVLVSGTLPAGWTVNGTVTGNLSMPPNTWQHWRVLLADRDARTKDVTVGANCEVKLLARDGVWRTSAPKDLSTRTVNMTGASRADLAVRCSANSTIKVNATTVANVVIAGSPDAGPNPYAADGVSTWSANRPSYLRDLRGVTTVNTEKISMGARTVNGSKFDVNTPTFTLNANAVQEWSIKGAVNHPFHLHIYHFQAQAGCGGDFEAGEYYDTMAGNCTVRFDLNATTSTPYAGRTIMHCHILTHEDQGAMTWMNVIGGTPAPGFPSGEGYSAYYSLTASPPAAPSAMSATAASSSAINLAWTDNSSNETGFTLERSLDGTSFAPLETVGVNVTAFSDTGLSANTTYWYRVNATNGSGTSAWSNTASATTLQQGGAEAVTVGSVTVTTVSVGKGLKQGHATVVVVDNLGAPVAGANVTGDFSGSFNEPGLSGTTDASGTAVIQTNATAKGGLSVTFCVTIITHTTLTDWTGSACATN
ncbi:MAG: multicopper oxidase domain-containing protein [Acidimicrobiia bacterium]|nr:multicopper oxidase domain-containing protein [Acidimicrobiia bacterium]